jgi:E3 ubiquitin-protein ligase Topors
MDWEGEVAANPDEPIERPTAGSEDGDSNKERCVICLMALRDRTIVGVCGHEFCVSVYGGAVC